MSIETDLKNLTAGLLNDPTPGVRWSPAEERRLRDIAPTRPTGGTVFEALEKLQTHAVAILADAEDVEQGLTGTNAEKPAHVDIETTEAGIWDRLARKIVLIERVFAQIDEAHHHAQASLK